uniref:Immunoglobulin domain-containing protein n=1 Tax=Amphilophus citrinellus TaxID=61819 RepID=A0A3Q0SME8_AMPCI
MWVLAATHHLMLVIFLTDSCCDTVTKIQSYEGYSVSISCTYESQYQNNLKYICRGNRPSTCLQQALVTSENKQNGRFRLDDGNILRIFTVTIGSLVQSDSGSYLCGVQRNSDLDVFSAVQLEVQGESSKKLCTLCIFHFMIIFFCLLQLKISDSYWIQPYR